MSKHSLYLAQTTNQQLKKKKKNAYHYNYFHHLPDNNLSFYHRTLKVECTLLPRDTAHSLDCNLHKVIGFRRGLKKQKIFQISDISFNLYLVCWSLME